MNVLELLRADHDQVEKFFDEIDAAEDFYSKQEIFQKIKRELELHAYVEESHFYPLLQDRDGFEELVDRGFDDHLEIKTLIEDIDSLDDEDEFDDLVSELIDSVQSHVEMEEEEIFPRVENSFTSDEIEQMGIALEEVKKASEAA